MAHDDAAGRRVFFNISEGLLENAEKSQLDIRGQARRYKGAHEPHGDAGPRLEFRPRVPKRRH